MNDHTNKIIKEHLNLIEYNFVNFIQPETQKVGNKIIWISAIIILLNLNFISLSEIESNGLKLLIANNYISYILVLINIYFYSQFYLLIRLDNLNFRIPKEIKSIIEEAEKKLLIYKEESEILKSEITQVTIEIENTIASNLNLEEKKKNYKILEDTLSNRQERLNETYEQLNFFATLIKTTTKKMVTGGKYLKYNNFLNSTFPKIIFLFSILLVIYNFISSYCS